MMKPLSKLLGLLATTAFCSWSTGGAAQTATSKDALIVSSFALAGDPVARDLRSDALAVSEALLGLGYNVRRLENPNGAALSGALRSSPDVIYYAATEAVLAGQMTSALSGADTLLFLDLCRAKLVLSGDVDPAWSLPAAQPENVFVAASVAPNTACGAKVAPVSDQLLNALQVPGLTLTAAFKPEDGTLPAWTRSTLSTPKVLRQPSSDMRLTVDDYALLESLSPEAQAKMIALWTQAGIAVDVDAGGAVASVGQVAVRDSIVISAPIMPVQTTVQVVSPRVLSGTARARDGISVIAPSLTASVENRAVPGVGGLPTPSVIIGLIGTEAGFGTVTEDAGTLSGSEFDYADIAARRAMRAENPVLFASLVDSGAFDPSPSELPFALQAELTRMNCYTLRIDGDWGAGSQAALRRYYDEIDASPENLAATAASFRQVLTQDDVTCPTVVAQPSRPAPTRQQARPATTNNTASRPRRSAPAAPQPAAPQPATPSRTISGSGVGIGINR